MLSITRLEIENFGPLKQIDLNLSSLKSNFITIQGSPGSGKTLLLSMIYFCLFGKDIFVKLFYGSLQFTIKDLEKYPCRVCLHINFNGEAIKLVRTLSGIIEKDLLVEHSQLTSLSDPSSECTEFKKLMGRIMAISRLLSDKIDLEAQSYKISIEMAALLNSNPGMKNTFEQWVSEYLEQLLATKNNKPGKLNTISGISFHIDDTHTLVIQEKSTGKDVEAIFAYGEHQLLNFCMELAFHDLILGQCNFPILLDSTFERLDHALSKSLMNFLKERQQQVICASTHYQNEIPDFHLYMERKIENMPAHSKLITHHEYNPNIHF